ncbi:DNA polymerase ligase domain-containing protein [Trichoderma austrokoningii]
MAMLIPNPCIKKRNLAWSLESPSASQDAHAATSAPATATTAQIPDHLAQFTSTLSSRLCPPSALTPRLSISDYSSLYQNCAGSQTGAHFVIHQHDHPVAGTHYDLRLQINETSSVSWAIMYGLPGDANSSRLNRNATETRIHSLWAKTGSLMIWDTGTYSVLARRSKHAPPEDPSSPTGLPSSSSSNKQHAPTAQSLLHSAFQNRKIRLRLHGTKLPDPYVINIRLTKTEDAAGRSRRSRKRRIRRPAEPDSTPSDSDDYGTSNSQDSANDEPQTETGKQQEEEKDAQVRLTNAYHGASNTIGSVYQRRWYLSLDRRACSFTEKRRHGRRVWERPPDFEEAKPEESESSCRLSFPFYVRGPRFERSVVTGRLGEQVLRDEGVTAFVPRKGWTPVMK